MPDREVSRIEGDIKPIGPKPKKPTVTFEPVSNKYRKIHYREDGRTLLDDEPVSAVTIQIAFNAAMKKPGTLEYELSGDAVEGVHYAIARGSESPLELSEGQRAASIQLTLDPVGEAGTRWFLEKLCRLTLTGGKQLKVGDADEFRLWIRALGRPPRLSFPLDAALGNSSGNPHKLVVRQAGLSQEPTVVHYRLGGTAVAGSDYTIARGSQSGVLTIAPGEKKGELLFGIDSGADGSGREIEVTLDHEADDQSEENLWTFTHDWALERDDPLFAGEPSDHAPGGGGLDPDTPKGERGLEVIEQAAAMPKSTPDGLAIQGVVQGQFMQENPPMGGPANWYIRESFENQVHCGGPVKLLPLLQYTRASVYAESFLPPDDWRDSTFVRLSLRNRTKSINHAVMFRRAETAAEVAEDWEGETTWGTPLQTPLGFFGFWRSSQVEGNAWGTDFGVALEVVDGQLRTRLWHSHFANGTTVFRSDQGDEVTEDLGQDGLNPIFRFTYFNRSDGSWDLTGGDVGNRGKGMLVYWPMLERSSDPLVGAPGRFWEKRRNWWEPRGNASRNTSNVTKVTFQIT